MTKTKAKPDIPSETPDWIKEEILRSTKASCLIPYVPIITPPPAKDKESILDRNTTANTNTSINKRQDKLIKIEIKKGQRITTSLTATGSYVSTYENVPESTPDGIVYDVKDEAKKKIQGQSDKDDFMKELSALGLLTRREELVISGVFHKANMLTLMTLFGKAGYAARCYPIRSSSPQNKDYFAVVVYKTPTALQLFEKPNHGAVGLFHVFRSFKDIVEGEDGDADARQTVEQ